MSKFRTVCLLLGLLGCGSNAANGGSGDLDLVHYADFTHVRHIAHSMTNVYFATTEGIVRYNKDAQRWEDPLTGTIGIDHRDIRRIWADLFDQKLYAQTSAGFFEYDMLFEEWFTVTEVPSLDSRGRHISPPPVLFTPGGFTYTSEGYLLDQYSRSFYLNDILDDGSGNWWIGTWGYGAATATSASSFLEFLPHGLLQNGVNAIYADGDFIWVGGSTFGAYRTGISRLDLYDNSALHIETGLGRQFPAADVNCLAGDDSFLYIGTTAGLYLYDQNAEQVERVFTSRNGLADDNVLSLEVLGDSIFVGTESGLNILTLAGDSIHYVRPSQFVNTVIFDFAATDSSIWIGSSEGAFQLLFESGRLRKFLDPNSIAFNRVYNIEIFDNDLWLASDGGVVRLDLEKAETESFVSITTGFRRRALAASDEIAAVASRRGVTVFFLDEERQASEREFGPLDGLPSDDIRCLYVDGDYLWIGSDRGLTRFLWNDPYRID